MLAQHLPVDLEVGFGHVAAVRGEPRAVAVERQLPFDVPADDHHQEMHRPPPRDVAARTSGGESLSVAGLIPPNLVRSTWHGTAGQHR
ncbi:hypothetical protein FG87_04395 [Nocardia vulneris]|uniref:Uncharacterized protein n=1 Tax=Nocardia vulneris TaxID=1141657 RepID=A0ABR4ZLB6_9NOCA|nr:hypothetical protein FG87_04395 [Nocardia vulneris]